MKFLKVMLVLAVILFLVLSTTCKKTPVKSTLEIGSLAISSVPSGAKIFINGNETECVTPYTLKNLNLGVYLIKLKLPGYIPWSESVSVSTNQVNATLTPAKGLIYVDSEPTGATIFLDGVNTSKLTPSIFENIRSGNYEIKLTLQNHEDWIGTVKVIKTLGSIIEAVLDPYSGTLVVNSTPSGASVWLNGQDTDSLTPAKFRLPIGTYMLELKLYGYFPRSGNVNIYRNQTTTVNRTLTLKCPGDTVGDLSLPPEIEIINLQPGDSRVYGIANNINAKKVKVVLWALTNYWYVQPYITSPYTTICGDGSWNNYTHPWKRMVVLVVDSTYVPGSVRYDHPAFEKGVLAWDQYPPPRPDLPLQFSDYSWGIKVSEDRFDPGPNYWSDDPGNVWVDGQGLHLKITYQNGHWTCSEIYLLESLGYGKYTFQLSTRVDSLDYRAVFAGFVYESPTREIDMEFSQVLADPNNAQYVIQPYTHSGNIFRFLMTPNVYSTHQFIWQADSIKFTSWQGHEETPHPDSIIQTWTYTGTTIPPPGAERMRFNLWLFGGNPPLSGVGDEVIVKFFKFEP